MAPGAFVLQTYDGIRDWSVTGVQTCAFRISSRRRHTRLVSDWSSDVCSSDLGLVEQPLAPLAVLALFLQFPLVGMSAALRGVGDIKVPTAIQIGTVRSEERRVGKECRSRWSPYH